MPGIKHQRQFGFAANSYDAIDGDHTTKRRAPRVSTMGGDNHLDSRRRRKLTANTRDAVRNFALASWAVKRHLDYVTAFRFQSKTGDQALDVEIENYIAERSKPHLCDAAGRHPLRRIIRNAEARRVIDGDIGIEKLAPAPPSRLRGTINAIEGDRVHGRGNPKRRNRDQLWTNGVKLDKNGRALAYSICARHGTGLAWQKTTPARNLYLHGYWDTTHRFDAVRGVSPLASALNTMRDVYEGFDYSLARIKVGQLFGLKITRDADGENDGYSEPTADADDDGNLDSGYKVDLTQGIVQIDMDPGHDADFLESKTPATETVNFLELMIHVALKALNIPNSFLDESKTNFFGSRAALLHYLRSCSHTIADNGDLLNWLTRWWLGLGVADGLIDLPRGLEFEALKFAWIPDGVPWWDPAKEVRGHALAIAMALDNPQRIAMSTGTDFFENVDKIAEAWTYAQDKLDPLGISLTLPGAPAFNPAPVVGASEDSE